MKYGTRAAALTAALALAVAACAQTSTAQAPVPAATTPQRPPCQDPLFRQFDFWLGEWDVFDPQGKLAGTNSIALEEYGCLLVERWTSAGGTTGQSYNFVDRASGKWRQVWVSAGATIDYSGGLNDKGQMALEGTIGYPGGGAAPPFRGTWSANADGTVTQHFEQYDSTKRVWADWFVGTYRKKSTPE